MIYLYDNPNFGAFVVKVQHKKTNSPGTYAFMEIIQIQCSVVGISDHIQVGNTYRLREEFLQDYRTLDEIMKNII